jgi:hypothetical protein
MKGWTTVYKCFDTMLLHSQTKAVWIQLDDA